MTLKQIAILIDISTDKILSLLLCPLINSLCNRIGSGCKCDFCANGVRGLGGGAIKACACAAGLARASL